ncbi:hypothetical protein BYT27DRAFT_7263017 [Phlegmacium glaucopus]|nr:hypothetical protein BYT27DRAFT_7263017 [Phlegmacium glaucopus]
MHIAMNAIKLGETDQALIIGAVRLNVVAEVIQRHGALSTAFFLNQGRLEQCVYPFLDFEISVVDLKAEANLEKLPLFRVTVFNLGSDEWSINFISHQIVMDQASLGLIFYELFMLYHKGLDSLDLQDMHFSDFSDWLFQISDHRAEIQTQRREFWNETLKDVQPTYVMSSTPSLNFTLPHVFLQESARTARNPGGILQESRNSW